MEANNFQIEGIVIKKQDSKSQVNELKNCYFVHLQQKEVHEELQKKKYKIFRRFSMIFLVLFILDYLVGMFMPSLSTIYKVPSEIIFFGLFLLSVIFFYLGRLKMRGAWREFGPIPVNNSINLNKGDEARIIISAERI